MKEELLEEYKMLREEIQNCVERDNSLSTFMVTAVATILTFAISANMQLPFLFLISFCIIIPFSARIAHYKGNVARISAYIVVYLESELSIKYETINIQVKNPSSKKSKLLISMRNYVGLWLGIISYAIYLEEYIQKIGVNNIFDFIFCMLPIVLLILTFVIDKRIDNVPATRNVWIELFKKNKEGNSK